MIRVFISIGCSSVKIFKDGVKTMYKKMCSCMVSDKSSDNLKAIQYDLDFPSDSHLSAIGSHSEHSQKKKGGNLHPKNK